MMELNTLGKNHFEINKNLFIVIFVVTAGFKNSSLKLNLNLQYTLNENANL